jgi:hypothetical protein
MPWIEGCMRRRVVMGLAGLVALGCLPSGGDGESKTSTSYVRDDRPPATPKITSVAPPVVYGRGANGSLVTLYRDAACANRLSLAATVVKSVFQIPIPEGTPSGTLYVRAADAAGNKSACSPGVAYTAGNGGECPALPADVPVSRAPVYGYLSLSYFHAWAAELNGEVGYGCADNPLCRSKLQQEWRDDKPAFGGIAGGYTDHPFLWGRGTVVEKGGQIDNRCVPPSDSAAYTRTIDSWCRDDCWSLTTYDDPKASYEIYGFGTNAIGVSLHLPPARPDQVCTRESELRKYLAEVGSATTLLPYADFGAHMFGRLPYTDADGVAHAAKGVFSFFDQDVTAYNGCSPADHPISNHQPASWLKRDWQDVNHPLIESLAQGEPKPPDMGPYASAGYDWASCSAPDAASQVGTYGPDMRLVAPNILNADFQAWQKEVLVRDVDLGYHLSYLDNAYFANCYNDECEAGFSAWLDQNFSRAERDRYFERPAPTLAPYGHFEAWNFAEPKCAHPYGTNLCCDATVQPSTDSYQGAYSARITPDVGATQCTFGHSLQIPPTEAVPVQKYKVSFAYRTEPGATVAMYANSSATPLVPPRSSGEWATAEAEVCGNLSTPSCCEGDPNPGCALPSAMSFVVSVDGGTAWIDSFVVRPSNPSDTSLRSRSAYECSYAVSSTRLPFAEEIGSDQCGTLRNRAAARYWSSEVDHVLGSYRTDVRATSGDPTFDLMPNSSRVVRGVGNFLVENHVPEVPADGRLFEGNPPGFYAAGTLTQATGQAYDTVNGAPVPTDVTVSNRVNYRVVANERQTDQFVRPFFEQQRAGGSDTLHNNDSALLALAESGALGGGAAVDLGLFLNDYLNQESESERNSLRSTLRRYYDFADPLSHPGRPDLFHCLEHRADFGVVFRSEDGGKDRNKDAVETIQLVEGLAAYGYTVDVFGFDGFGARSTDLIDKLSKYRVVILSHTKRLSEAEVVTVLAAQAAGTRVIWTADTGHLDELGRRGSAIEGSAWPRPTTPDAPRLTASDVNKWLSGYPVSRVCTTQPGGGECSPNGLQISTWWAPDRGVVHLMNYATPHGKCVPPNPPSANGSCHPATAVLNSTVRVIVPDGHARPRHAKLLSPEDAYCGCAADDLTCELDCSRNQPQPHFPRGTRVPVHCTGSICSFNVASVGVYTAAVLE